MWLRGFLPLVLVAVVFPREGDGEDSGCGTPKQQTGLSGTFSSINYPNNYGHGARCTWIITVKPRWRIRIHFKSPFGFESHSSCRYDYVSLSEEVTSTTPIGKYCNAPPSSDVISQDNDMVVVFESDGSNADTGFSLQWTAVEPEYSGCGSRYKLSGKSGSISSMNYPNIYQNNADCSWVITVPAGMRVRLDFEKKFEIEPGPQHYCSFDNVVVRQEDAAGVEGRSLGTFCGFSAPTNLLVSDDNNIAVSFKSDSTAAFAGFSIRWKAIYACGTPEVPQNGTVSLSDEDKVNSKATYSCNAGFKLVGKNRQCLTSGLWAGGPPTCQEILCPPPPVPAHGTLSLTDGHRVNSTATFTCNEGYKLSGGTDRRCLIVTGDWSGDMPVCEEIRCGAPPLLVDGNVYISNEKRIGSKARYTCDDGFKLIGTPERQCLGTGNWSGDMPVCEEIRCGAPPLLVDGNVYIANEDKIGSNVTYTCNDGFKLIGASERQCLRAGNWSGDMPVCEDIHCGAPPLLVDGNVSISNEDKIGSKATYTCDDGFKLIGTPERRCLGAGNWSGVTPTCEEIRCGTPSLSANGSVSLSDGDRLKSKVTYACDDGFLLTGEAVRECLSAGNWSGEPPICQELRCGLPDTPANGSVSLSDEDRMDSKATYTCDDGFLLDGEGVNECVKTGNWSGEVPMCQEIRCGSPSIPANGSVLLSDEDRLNSNATYVCDDGFRLTGEIVRVCLKTGNWSEETPTCQLQEIRCSSPSTPTNGSVSLSDEDRLNSSATYTCSDGFLLVGEDVRECLQTGNWSGRTPICREIRCSFPGTPDNGRVFLSDEDRVNSIATYTCGDGFLVSGDLVRECLNSGNWSGETPICQEIRCGSPGGPANGRSILSDEDRMHSIAVYMCDDGYKMIGHPESQCLRSGNWSADMPVCKVIRCGAPPLLADGSVSLSNQDKKGSKATYTCGDGFKLIGTSESVCLETGNWSGGMPVCEELRCGSLALLVDGSMSLTNVESIGSKARFTCNDGFKLIGTSERRCLATGNWSGDMPVCEEIRCGSLALLVDGSFSLSNHLWAGSKATYSCNDGFKLIGTPERRCLRTGNWSGDRPLCQEIRCGPPDKLDNGRILLSDEDRLDSMARYVCNDGFTLSGESGRRCDQTGRWSGNAPECKEIRCSPLEQLAHGRVSLSDQDKWNSQATYVCDDGFRMVGKTQRLCLATWKWTGTAPSCQEIRCGSPEVPAGCTISLTNDDRIGSRVTYSCKEWSSLGETERRCLGTGEWSGTAPHTQGKEGPRDVISLPSKQKVDPAPWSNSPYIDVYLCIGIVFNIVFLTLGICGTVYGVYRIKRRRGSQKDTQKLSSFNFDNPAFNGVEERETQIAV